MPVFRVIAIVLALLAQSAPVTLGAICREFGGHQADRCHVLSAQPEVGLVVALDNATGECISMPACREPVPAVLGPDAGPGVSSLPFVDLRRRASPVVSAAPERPPTPPPNA